MSATNADTADPNDLNSASSLISLEELHYWGLLDVDEQQVLSPQPPEHIVYESGSVEDRDTTNPILGNDKLCNYRSVGLAEFELPRTPIEDFDFGILLFDKLLEDPVLRNFCERPEVDSTPAPKKRKHSPHCQKLTNKKKTKRPVSKQEAGITEDAIPVDVKDSDVLCERGARSNSHPGNRVYLRELKPLFQVQYMAETTKKIEKTIIAQQLVDAVKCKGGRFLRRFGGHWYPVDDLTARKKASQTLREVKKA